MRTSFTPRPTDYKERGEAFSAKPNWQLTPLPLLLPLTLRPTSERRVTLSQEICHNQSRRISNLGRRCRTEERAKERTNGERGRKGS